MYAFAVGLVVIKTVKNEGTMVNNRLDWNKQSKKSMYSIMKALPDSDTDALFLSVSNVFKESTADNLLELYSSACGCNSNKIERDTLDNDNTFIQSIAANLVD